MPKDTIEAEADEKEVQEVRCALTGVPIPAVPNWYASVRVRFVSDHARLKSGAPLLRAPEVAEPEAEDALAESTEISLEDVEEDLVVDDEIDLDIVGEEVADIDEE